MYNIIYEFLVYLQRSCEIQRIWNSHKCEIARVPQSLIRSTRWDFSVNCFCSEIRFVRNWLSSPERFNKKNVLSEDIVYMWIPVFQSLWCCDETVQTAEIFYQKLDRTFLQPMYSIYSTQHTTLGCKTDTHFNYHHKNCASCRTTVTTHHRCIALKHKTSTHTQSRFLISGRSHHRGSSMTSIFSCFKGLQFRESRRRKVQKIKNCGRLLVLLLRNNGTGLDTWRKNNRKSKEENWKAIWRKKWTTGFKYSSTAQERWRRQKKTELVEDK